MLLLPLKSSGAIHGNVPRTPPDTKVFCFTLDKPKSPIWRGKRIGQKYISLVLIIWGDEMIKNLTLHTGRWGSLMFTRRFSHFKSKWTMFFPCKYSIPKAVSMAMMSLLRRSMVLDESTNKISDIWILCKISIIFNDSVNLFTCLSSARTVSKIR